LIRGTAYGFLCWIVAALTVTPLLHTATLDWSPGAVAAAQGIRAYLGGDLEVRTLQSYFSES